jgi:hypothetical protein
VQIPYSILPVKPDPAFPQRNSITRPIVALHLAHGENQIVTFALVDSGADHCIFPASIAEALGISIPDDNASIFSGSSEGAQIAYFEQVQATILPMDAPDIDPNQPPVTFPLFAGFCETLEHIGMGLLGQDGFFSHHTVIFHNAQSYFEVL